MILSRAADSVDFFIELSSAYFTNSSFNFIFASSSSNPVKIYEVLSSLENKRIS